MVLIYLRDQLVKSRVQASDTNSRVGIKIRANPSNLYCLTTVTVVLAVPPVADASTVKMSRSGGVWDEMKRIIVWSSDSLEPGEALEFQVQFSLIDNVTSSSRRFPILVRCEYPALFSSVEVVNDTHVARRIPVELEVVPSGSVLHRKV
jgi:hypothetical protein